jgi:hypothetical protein
MPNWGTPVIKDLSFHDVSLLHFFEERTVSRLRKLASMCALFEKRLKEATPKKREKTRRGLEPKHG